MMMKRTGIFFVGLALAAVSIAAPRPNVVIIYGDDVGFGDVGVYGAKLIPTPNIDRLAQEGLQFMDGHCTASTCTPSRYSMLTGVYGFRHGLRVLPPNAPLLIPTDLLTLPKVFKKAGYTTGVIGKWHLGLGQRGVPVDWNGDVKPGPMEIGFDYSFLMPSTNDRVPTVYLEGHRVVNLDPSDPLYVGTSKAGVDKPGSTPYPDGKKNREAMTYYESSHGHDNSVINGIGRIGYMAGGKAALWDDEGMADEFVKQATKFITAHKDKPFFLYFASQDVHVPRTPHPRFHGKTSLGYRGDSMVQFDWTTGQIMEILEKAGVADNTIVIFSSDNGPVYDDGYRDGTTVQTSSAASDGGHFAAGPHRGGKYQIYEGGTRIPLIIRWPGTITPGKSNALVSQIDFIASFAKLLNVKLENEDAVDSRESLAALLGRDLKGHAYTIEESGSTALRKGKWKYIPPKKKQASGELYDLEKDIGETENKIADFPKIAVEMDEILEKLIADGRMRPRK